MPDPVPLATKTAWLQELTLLQEELSAERLAKLVNTQQRALLESAEEGYLQARLADNSVVRVLGDASLIGRYATVRINDARSWIMNGEILTVE